MKLAIVSSIFFALVAALPVEDTPSEVHPENAEIFEAIAAEAAAADAALMSELDEVPGFISSDNAPTKLRGHCGQPRHCRHESSSSDSCDCCSECEKVYYDWLDFYTSIPSFYVDPTNVGTWSYFNLSAVGVFPAFIADDGVLATGCSGGVLNSKVFTSFQPGLSPNPLRDNAKFWIYANAPMPVPPHGDAIIRWTANVQTYLTQENPFPSAIVERNDYRLASGQFTAFDTVTGLNFGFVMTNHRVYILYQSSPALVPAPVKAPLAGFTFLVPVKIRRVCDWHEMEVILHGDTQEVSYRVDGQEVFVITKVGYLLDREYMVDDDGGAEAPVWPASLFYGFGSFTDLDWYPACQRSESCRTCRYPFMRQSLVDLNDGTAFTQYNPVFGAPTPPVYYVTSGPTSQYKLWGQGLITNIRKLVAYQQLPTC